LPETLYAPPPGALEYLRFEPLPMFRLKVVRPVPYFPVKDFFKLLDNFVREDHVITSSQESQEFFIWKVSYSDQLLYPHERAISLSILLRFLVALSFADGSRLSILEIFFPGLSPSDNRLTAGGVRRKS
jgi:hypothetical protein